MYCNSCIGIYFKRTPVLHYTCTPSKNYRAKAEKLDCMPKPCRIRVFQFAHHHYSSRMFCKIRTFKEITNLVQIEKKTTTATHFRKFAAWKMARGSNDSVKHVSFHNSRMKWGGFKWGINYQIDFFFLSLQSTHLPPIMKGKTLREKITKNTCFRSINELLFYLSLLGNLSGCSLTHVIGQRRKN